MKPGSKINDEAYRQLMDKYKHKLNSNLGVSDKETDDSSKEKINSLEYESFKQEYIPTHMSLYEKACNYSEKILKIKPDEKKEKEIQEAIDICHLNITPTGATSFGILVPFFFMTFGAFFGYAFENFVFKNPVPGAPAGMFFAIFSVFLGIILYPAINKIPSFLANNWRLKASNQMVLCVFYIVTYMRHTSNLENAIEFASEHLSPPLSLDLKKVLWNVETEKYESVKESLDVYLESWKKWNMEFIEAMHLIESSLYETSEERRVTSLDKAINIMLDETYDKMLHYAHGLQSPLMMLNMMGIILPILGLVILPLAVSFLDGIKWYHLSMIYNVALPIGVFYLGTLILSSRPTGYGASDIEDNAEIKKFKNVIINIGGKEVKIPPLYLSFFVGIILLFVGISPLVMHEVNPDFELPLWGQDKDGQGGYFLMGYKPNKYATDVMEGPFGFGSALLSFFITLGVGLSLGLYFKFRSDNVIKIREETKKLELEFSAALFQLGNRLGDGLPPEIAFSKVAEIMEGSISGQFFNEVTLRITKLGMSVEQAIFDKQHGALILYPSSLIESSMKVFLESSKKGPRVASNALINVSEYIKQIHKVDERLKDLLAEVISSMKSQISFLTPVISGIVIGITSMITSILINLGEQFKKVGTGDTGGAGIGGMTDFFGNGIPTYYFQLIVGIYVIQIVFILTILINGIENGSDKLNERYMLGQNLTKSTILYCLIAIAISFAFNMVASSIMGSLTLG